MLQAPARLLTLALTPLASAQTFGPPREISNELEGITTAAPIDVDGDGDLDIVACARLTPGVRVYWNAGGGDFVGHDTIAEVLTLPRAVAGADMDGDGDVDLLIGATRGGPPFLSGLWYVEADAPGQFRAPVLLGGSPFHSEHIEIVDLDGDGDLDATVGGQVPYSVSETIVENLGGGVLFARLKGGTSGHLLPIDVDGDGALDLLQGGNGRLLWTRSRAPFVYETPRLIEIFASDGRIALGDLDGDGLEEVVSSIRGAPRMLVFRNLGSGAFGQGTILGTAAAGEHEHALVDVDLDGDDDIVFSHRSGPGPHWFESDGALGFTPRGALTGGASTRCDDLRVADLDGDGLRDLVLAAEERHIEWVRGDASIPGGSGFESGRRRITSGVGDLGDVVILDVDADGAPDIVAASRIDGISIAFGDGVGGQRAWTRSTVVLGGCRSLAVMDVDADGLVDLLFRASDGRLAYALSGPGGPGASTTIDSLPAGTTDDLLDLGDADGDGDIDVFVNDGDGVLLYRNVGPSSFAPRTPISAPTFTPVGVSVGDLNGDALSDLVLAHEAAVGAVVAWRPGLPGGGHGPFEVLFTGFRDRGAPAVADVEFDGRDEIVIADRGMGAIVSIGVDGSGATEAPVVRRSGIGDVEDVVYEDTDANQVRELLLARRDVSGARELIRLPALQGSIGALEVLMDDIDGVGRVSVADLEGDGDRDLTLALLGARRIVVLENRTRLPLGVTFCGAANTNSSGRAASLIGLGLERALVNEFSLRAFDLPPAATTLFLVSRLAGQTPTPVLSGGDLCLGGVIGRFVAPGQVGAAGQNGVRTIEVDLQSVPVGGTTFAVGSQDSVYFQAWYRDGVGSNFTTGLAVSFD